MFFPADTWLSLGSVSKISLDFCCHVIRIITPFLLLDIDCFTNPAIDFYCFFASSKKVIQKRNRTKFVLLFPSLHHQISNACLPVRGGDSGRYHVASMISLRIDLLQPRLVIYCFIPKVGHSLYHKKGSVSPCDISLTRCLLRFLTFFPLESCSTIEPSFSGMFLCHILSMKGGCFTIPPFSCDHILLNIHLPFDCRILSDKGGLTF